MNYRLIRENPVPELKGEAKLYEHTRSGARVMTVKNHDKNKVFMIAFRTPPEDSTGVAHIMEHSVLCGSRKYPIKDPFVELAKGSLNTFLNAMTYPDKTVYPIASVNDRDFMNLMDVYLDAVFYPRIYEEPRIFLQEGWHYEIGEEGELIYNGVVYNEMRGVFSNPDAVLERFTMSSLYPGTTYAHESGGAPEDIPSLSYEEFLDFHRRYYHPSNSYIWLYGDMDMEDKLKWLDSEYLKHFTLLEPDSGITPGEEFDKEREESTYYALSDNEDLSAKAYLAESFAIAGEPTGESALAWQALDYVLLHSPGAVLREALIKAGIGQDIDGGYVGELMRPYFTVVARHAEAGRKDDFGAIIHDTLEDLTLRGISKKSLRAAVNYLEFKAREEDYGTLPMGLVAGLSALSGWIYDRDPFQYLYYEDAFRGLVDKIDTDYFEELLRVNILTNNHSSMVSVLPEKGLTRSNDAKLKEKLRAVGKSLGPDKLKNIENETAALKAYQNTPDPPEALKCLPALSVEDIDKAAETGHTALKDGIIHTEADCNGIAYISIIFDTSGLSEEEIETAALIGDILTEIDTTKSSYADLSDEIFMKTGGISFGTAPYMVDGGGYLGLFTASLRVMEDHIAEGMKLIGEILADSVYDDPGRIKELINELKTRQKSETEGAMHKAAVTRAASYLFPSERYVDITSGIAYYDYLSGVAFMADEPVHLKRFIRSIKAVAARLFDPGRMSVYIYGSPRARDMLSDSLPGLKEELNAAVARYSDEMAEEINERGPGARVTVSERPVINLSCLNEGLKTSSEVNYDAVVGDYRDKGLKYHGGLNVLRVMLSYDYLWTRLRVLGGAYGCMSAFLRSGLMYMTSYRDPEIAATYRVYEELPEYLMTWQGDEDTVAKFIIGAIAALDHPLTHSQRARDELRAYIYGLTDKMRQEERDEILRCTAEDIRGFSVYIRALLDSGARCTIGSADAVDKDEALFKTVRGLF